MVRFGDDVYFGNIDLPDPIYNTYWIYYTNITDPTELNVTDYWTDTWRWSVFTWAEIRGDYLFTAGTKLYYDSFGSFFKVFQVNTHPSSLSKRSTSSTILSTTCISFEIFPNPFNSTAKITIQLPENDNITIAIYDITGRKVKNYTPGIIPKGSHSFVWDGTNNDGYRVSSGLYFIRLETNNDTIIRRAIYLK